MIQKTITTRSREQSPPLKKRRESSLATAYKKHYQLVLMVVPGLVAMLLFNYLPMAGIVMAFKEFRVSGGIWFSPWADNYGMANFIRLFTGQDFWPILRNTLVISLLKLICGFPAPIILALLLNEVRHSAYKRVVQTFSYLPHFFSWVVLAGMIRMIFSTQGPVNDLYRFMTGTMGDAYQFLDFYGNPTLFISMLVGTAVWQGLGWGSIIYIAALSGVDASLYEAAYMDGAGRWKQVFHVSLPGIAPAIATVFILNLGGVLNAGFDQVYNMQNETVKSVSNIIDTYVIDALKRYSMYGFASAMGLFKSVIGLIFVLGANAIVKKINSNQVGIM